MNLILVERAEIYENSIVLEDNRAEHIVKVLKACVGDTVRVGEVNGLMGVGTIRELQKKYPFFVRLELNLHESPQALPPIDLILALPRPIMLRRILSQATALGVGRIFLVNAKRVEKSFWASNLLGETEMRQHLLAGLEQAVDTRVPGVSLHRQFRPFVEDIIPQVSGEYCCRLVGHPGGKNRLGDIIGSRSGRIIMAVGPEGGWIDYEVEKFQEQGFGVCSLGSRILKVDTAVIALHSRISAFLEMN